MIKNNKGFITIELIVVSVFALALFGIIYMNSYLAFQAYERKEVHDDVDSKYAGYWIKRYINTSIKDDVKEQITKNISSGNKIIAQFTCNDLNTNEEVIECTNLFTRLNVKNVYITSFTLQTFKEYTKRENASNNNTIIVQDTKNQPLINDFIYISQGMYDYIKKSPDYINNKAEIPYRLFIETEEVIKVINNGVEEELITNKYGTMELEL